MQKSGSHRHLNKMYVLDNGNANINNVLVWICDHMNKQ